MSSDYYFFFFFLCSLIFQYDLLTSEKFQYELTNSVRNIPKRINHYHNVIIYFAVGMIPTEKGIITTTVASVPDRLLSLLEGRKSCFKGRLFRLELNCQKVFYSKASFKGLEQIEVIRTRRTGTISIKELAQFLSEHASDNEELFKHEWTFIPVYAELSRDDDEPVAWLKKEEIWFNN